MNFVVDHKNGKKLGYPKKNAEIILKFELCGFKKPIE